MLFTILLYLSVYLIIDRVVKSLVGTENVDVESHPGVNWPLSGLAGRAGNVVVLLAFVPSGLLALLNPLQLLHNIRQLLGQQRAAARLAEIGNDLSDYKTRIRYRLPFDGTWLTFNGGQTPGTSHSWNLLAQRYAYDFVIADEEFRRHKGKGNRLPQYLCYDRPIVAAADGEVVSVVENIRDGLFVGYGVANFLCRNLAGNYVVIKHAEGEYGFYAHLIKDSIRLNPGDQVARGQPIGRVGYTGQALEPHLHFHLQDKPAFYQSLGLPIQFTDLQIDGQTADENSKLSRGQRVVSMTA
ncbi:MAG: M23 family metallopeptidase [Pirellulaceae bacterium]|nr:M23 family metallopeptidase [Pirellulaceae bacterium]